MQQHRNPNWVHRDQSKNFSASPYSLSEDEKLSVMEALDHLHVTRQYQGMGCCAVCKKLSIKKCSGCSTFYCSSECQTFDWPKHRVICTKQRDNASDRGSFTSGKQMRCSSSVKNLNEGAYMNNHRSPFTTLANQLNKKPESMMNETRSFTTFKIANKQYQNRDSNPKGSNIGGNNGKKNNSRKSFSPKDSKSSKKSSPEQNKGTNKRNNNKINRPDVPDQVLKSTENIPRGKTQFPKGKTQSNSALKGETEVIATYRESSDRYWVMTVDNLRKYEEIQDVLNKECKNYETVYPKVGLVCGCTFGDEWFRGEIIKLTPDVVVHFIDYGNVANYDTRVFKRLPDNLQSVPALAFQIEFEEGTPWQYKTENLESLKFKVEETAKAPDGVSRVKVIEGMYGATGKPLQLAKPPERRKSEQTNIPKERSVMESISVNSIGMLFFVPGEGNIRYASVVPDNNKDANESIEKVLNIGNPNSSPVMSKPGDLVLVVDKEGNNQRAKVLFRLRSVHYVQLIDCGNMIAAENVYPLPEDLKELVYLGVKVTVEEVVSQDQMKDLQTCFFTVKGEAVSGKWPCTLKGPKQQIIAQVLLEKPEKKMAWVPKFVALKSGSTVEITSFHSGNSIYVRPVDVEMEQKFLNMNMEMIQFAPKAKDFDEPPSPGDLCCAKFKEDNCFYRAVVTSVEGEKATVGFFDFGNEQETSLQDIKPLPETLKNVPVFAVKVTLKDVPTDPWNNMIKDYMNKLYSENVELTLTFKGPLTSGVILQEKISGVVVNDFIQKATSSIHSDRSLSSRAEIFLDDDMKYTNLVRGNSCTLAVLYVSEYEFNENQTFWATDAKAENFNYVNVELSTVISEHCESVLTPYEPTFRELCLAEFEDSWYRAICAGQTGNTYKVFFVDFGNCCEVKSGAIRKMQKDFLQAPALAVNCTLSGRDRLKGNPKLTQEICEKLVDRINTFIEGVTVTKFEEDAFYLMIPEIEAMITS